MRLGADTLSRLLDDLSKPGALERRREGERQLCEFVEAEARDLGADAFSKFMTEVYARLGTMIKRWAGGRTGVRRRRLPGAVGRWLVARRGRGRCQQALRRGRGGCVAGARFLVALGCKARVPGRRRLRPGNRRSRQLANRPGRPAPRPRAQPRRVQAAGCCAGH